MGINTMFKRKFYLIGSSAALFYRNGKRLRMPSVRSVAAWHQPAHLPYFENG